MKKGKWILRVRGDFAAAHALRNYEGPCESLHGHNFGVEVEVEGDRLDEDVQIVCDFKVLKREMKEVLATLDHHDLNALAPFLKDNPSSENLARHIYLALEKRLSSNGVRMRAVTVSESPGSSATYLEE